MQARTRRSTWTVGECTFSCESRIFAFVIAEEGGRETAARAERARAAEPDRPRRRRAKRALA
jgi:hypothetical protein